MVVAELDLGAATRACLFGPGGRGGEGAGGEPVAQVVVASSRGKSQVMRMGEDLFCVL